MVPGLQPTSQEHHQWCPGLKQKIASHRCLRPTSQEHNQCCLRWKGIK